MHRAPAIPDLTRRRRALLRCALAAVVLALGLGGTASEAGAAAPRYRTKPGVRLSPIVAAKLGDIAAHYYRATRRTLLVTSGTRSPREQAEAMYGKLRAGDRLWVYRNQAAVAPLRDAYDRGRKQRWKRGRVIDAMADLLAGQVARGVYISRHLRAHAFDVRSYDLTARQKRAFRAAAEAVGGVRVIEERRPPHFHCEVRLPRTPDVGPDDDEGPEDDGDRAETGEDGGAPPADADTSGGETAPDAGRGGTD